MRIPNQVHGIDRDLTALAHDDGGAVEPQFLGALGALGSLASTIAPYVIRGGKALYNEFTK